MTASRLALALAFGMLGLIAFDVLSSKVTREPSGALAQPAPSTASSPNVVDEPAGDPDAREATPSQRVGDLRVRAVDPTTRAPVAGIACVLFGSWFDPEPLATGTTDAGGSALFAGLAEGSVRVATLRAPPRAAASAVAWIEGGAVAECEIEVGRGGALFGRVVDDSGAPLAGFELQLAPTRAEVVATGSELGIPVGRTDAQGRFRVDALASPPHWSSARKSGEALWATREPVGLWAGPPAELASPHRPYLVLEGEELDVGDLVVEREQVHAGRVVDADGRGIGGALVSAHLGRRRKIDSGPGMPGFALLPGEVTTASDGSFELRVRRSRAHRIADAVHALVWTARGVRTHFSLTDLAPGERVDGLTWTIQRDEALELVLLDPDGAPLEPERTLGRFEVESLNGVRAMLAVRRDADGVHRAPLPFARAELGALRMRLRDYRPAEVEGEPLRGDWPVPVRLEPLPRLRLLLALPPQEGWTKRSAKVVACSLPPDLRSQWGCCGATEAVAEAWLAGDLRVPVDVAVRTESTWVYVTDDVLSAEETVHVFGPFEPGEGTIELELPPLVRREDRPAPDPARFMAGEVELYAVDASSGEPIEGASPMFGESDARGRILLRVRSDDSELSLDAYGFAGEVIALPEPLSKERMHLGTIRLVREAGEAPRSRIRIADSDRDMPRAYFVRVLVAAEDGQTSVEGSWENGLLPLGAGPGDVAWVFDHGYFAGSTNLRRTTLPDPLPSEVVELELAVPLAVEIRLLGLPDALLEKPLSIDIAVLDDVTDPRALESAGDEALLPSRDGVRTFRFGASPGTYRVTVVRRDRKAFEAFEPLTIHVRDAPGVQAFELAFDER